MNNSRALFPLGKIVATPGALDTLARAGQGIERARNCRFGRGLGLASHFSDLAFTRFGITRPRTHPFQVQLAASLSFPLTLFTLSFLLQFCGGLRSMFRVRSFSRFEAPDLSGGSDGIVVLRVE